MSSTGAVMISFLKKVFLEANNLRGGLPSIPGKILEQVILCIFRQPWRHISYNWEVALGLGWKRTWLLSLL